MCGVQVGGILAETSSGETPTAMWVLLVSAPRYHDLLCLWRIFSTSCRYLEQRLP